jgi:ATP-dependent helicase/nuclease subunit A
MKRRRTMSPRIEVISASAGSGKTYRLTEELEKEVKGGTARPTAILGTTFTNKAAAELERRVRTRLIGAGLFEQAQELAGARLGTVN